MLHRTGPRRLPPQDRRIQYEGTGPDALARRAPTESISSSASLRINAATRHVISGNNRRKTDYLGRAVAAGFHTLADKPMAIDSAGFAALGKAFAVAETNGVLLYDIMTERHEITTMLQKEFSTIASIFGGLAIGSEADPAVTKESVHHFAKQLGRGSRAGVVLRYCTAGRRLGRHHDASR
jgi:hypothetical protein